MIPRWAIRLCFIAFVVVLVLLSAGCATAGIYRGSGEVAPTPPAHDELCRKQKDMPGCPK